MVYQLCDMGAGDKRTVETTFSFDDALEWFMFKKYDAHVQDKMTEQRR
jgi:hypothetical protein